MSDVSGSEGRGPRPFRRRGFSPELLLAQVRSTAGWALEGARAGSWRDTLLSAPSLEPRWREEGAREAYFATMLAAHFTTVATFVPTDVDPHIRHHVWQEVEDPSELSPLVLWVDEAATWDPKPVSARVVAVRGAGEVHGHAGEWLSVRAGALGRALLLGQRDVAEALEAAIEAELAHEARTLRAAMDGGDALVALRVTTTIAHNTGDLSRVVEAWPGRTPRKAELVERFCRLGHAGGARFGHLLALAGHVNKAVMAAENHRFLPLRAARVLRRDRAFLLPLGPTFDGWGERVARGVPSDADRAEVLSALLEGHAASPAEAGYLRAIAGLHRGTPGGIERIADGIPARLRKLVARGRVRDEIGRGPEALEARLRKAWAQAIASFPRRVGAAP